MHRRSTVAAPLMLLIITAMTAWTYPSGITGVTRKSGGSGCSNCHSGSSIDGVVTISGPTALKVGQAGTYTLTIGSGTLIGCDIAASSGTLAKVSPLLQLLNGELTHSQKMSGTSVQFTWTPTAAGTQTLYATGARTSKNGGWGHATDFSVAVTDGGIAGVDQEQAPVAYALDQNFPNPFNPSTTIRFTIPQSADVTLTVMNVIGNRIATLVTGRLERGTHSLVWDASGIPSGMYFYRLEARDGAEGSSHAFTQTRKLLLLK